MRGDDHLGDVFPYGSVILKLVLGAYGVKVWIELNGRLLSWRRWTYIHIQFEQEICWSSKISTSEGNWPLTAKKEYTLRVL